LCVIAGKGRSILPAPSARDGATDKQENREETMMLGKLRGALPALALFTASALAAAPTSAQIIVKVGAPTIRDNNEVWMNAFKEELEKATQGKYRVDTYPGGQLGSLPRSLDGVQLGTIELTITIAEFMGGLDKRFGVVSTPGVFDSPMHGYRTVQDPEFKAAYWTLGESKGLKMVGLYCPTDTNYVFRTPIKSVADFKGKKVRTFPSALERETLGTFGATPAPMSLEEVLPAIQQGVIDGSKSGMTVFVMFKYQVAAKYAIRTNETMICTPVVASKLWLDKQPMDVQKAVEAAARVADQKAQDFSHDFNENAYVEWVKGGGVLVVPTADERATMMKQLADVGDRALKEDPATLATLQIMKRVAARVRQ
jgi:C4-dicarboxylate-binding protein DctP